MKTLLALFVALALPTLAFAGDGAAQTLAQGISALQCLSTNADQDSTDVTPAVAANTTPAVAPAMTVSSNTCSHAYPYCDNGQWCMTMGGGPCFCTPYYYEGADICWYN